MEKRKMKLANITFPISNEEILRQNQEFRKNGKYSRKIERAVSVSINTLDQLENKKELTKEEEKKKAITKEIIELHNGKICAKSNDEFIEFQIELKK